MNDNSTNSADGFSCPLESDDDEVITLAHGSGGRLSRQLLETVLLPAFDVGSDIDRSSDSVVLDLPAASLAFTTDSYVITPRFFPGGDIGALAVSGTVNDLAMSGASPRYISLGLVIEEGFSRGELVRIVQSVALTARDAGVQVVAGDTKVVEKGQCDGLYINTSGIGVFNHNLRPGAAGIQHGDRIIVSGDIGRHGMAVMSQREQLGFEAAITSDMACLNQVVDSLFDADLDVHCMRDMTRGGLATILIELAAASGLHFCIEQQAVPVSKGVNAACQLLGFDPFYVANEGRFVAFVPECDVDKTLAIMHRFGLAESAAVIGEVQAGESATVTLTTAYGTKRTLHLLSGEQLPRIC